MYSRIRVPAEWRDATGRQHFGIADFQLGYGSCGKVVSRLEIEVSEAGVLVNQYTECGEEKQFFYPARTLTGRVETTITR